MISLTLRLLYTRRRVPSIGNWKGPTAGLNVVERKEISVSLGKINPCFLAQLIISNIKVANLFEVMYWNIANNVFGYKQFSIIRLV
jgi:hypothetical protein